MPATIKLGHLSGDLTTIVIPYEPGHDDIAVIHDADPAELNSDPTDLAGNSLRNHRWLHSLPEQHRPYFIHMLDIDDLWRAHGGGSPADWVSCAEHPDLEEALAAHFSGYGHTCRIRRDEEPPEGGPEGPSGGGSPPAGPGPAAGPAMAAGAVQTALTAMLAVALALYGLLRMLLAGFTNDGKDLIARALGDSQSYNGTTTSAPTATAIADTGKAFPASAAGANGVHQGGLVGHIVRMATAYGVIIANTATGATIDMWHTYGAPDTVATTPGTGAYEILPGAAPACFTGISAATRAFNAADQFLSNDGTTISEIWSAAGGLKRKIATWAHTVGTNTTTLTTTWTANGSDALPFVAAKWGAFVAEVTAAPAAGTSGPLLFNTNLASTATLAASGDNVTVTDTVTES